MNYAELRSNIEEGKYDCQLPYSPYRKNPVARARYRDADKEIKKAWRDDNHRLYLAFKADIRNFTETTLNLPITDAQFTCLFDKASEDGHTCGYGEVLDCLSELLYIVHAFRGEK